MELMEKYETLVKQVKEVTSAVQEEADARQSAIEELKQFSDWLKDTLTSVQSYSDASGTADERSSRNKVRGTGSVGHRRHMGR
ncbi:hypothetical protein ElyMa_004451200 [Elysia marginata]|uniref:Uncharacterized protein n=1 Tax=Elysia marginata TaxID=1093978 RepID=A0AAV4HFL3_9GAST|nr:hypothetical protein ElyMa_004451200 [Elysia marginata]